MLLCSHLGDPQRPVLSVARFRQLAARAAAMEKPDTSRDLTLEDLKQLGTGREEAERILQLLSQEQLLEGYLSRAEKLDCFPITRANESYPVYLRRRLGLDSPACLWARGDVTLLSRPMIALVGSRDLYPENAYFAREAGRQAARQGYVLLSGNARGADRAAQLACLDAGGHVVSVVADRLDSHPITENTLWLSEDSYDLDFTAQRALSRNRVIHALPRLTLVAQCRAGQGGNWSGTAGNLRHHWSKVCVFEDGSEAAEELKGLGAVPVSADSLQDLDPLIQDAQLQIYE